MKKKLIATILMLAIVVGIAKTQTWDCVKLGIDGHGVTPITCIKYASESVAYVIINSYYIYKSVDYGKTWTNVLQTGSVMYDLSCLDVNNIIAVGDSTFVSNNGGTTWNRYTNLGIILKSVVWVATNQIRACGASSPVSKFYFISVNGSSWTNIAVSMTGIVACDKIGTIRGTNITYLYTSVSFSGIAIKFLPSGVVKTIPYIINGTTSVSFYDANHGFVSVYRTSVDAGSTYYTSDGGTTWTKCTVTTGGFVISNGTVTYVGSGWNDCVYKSTDGLNFTNIGTLNNIQNYNYVRVIDLSPSGNPIVGTDINMIATLINSQTITMSPLSAVTYGSADITITASASSGLPLTLTTSDNTIATIVSGKVHVLKAGTVNIIANQPGNGLWSAAPQVSQALTINKASITATADNKTRIYGDANPTFTISYSGFVNSDSKSNITEPTASCTATTSSVPASYAITLSGGTSLNYNIVSNIGILTVNKASIVVMAQNLVKTYGQSNPIYTVSYSGFKGTDNASLISILPILSCPATTLSPAGTYTITASSASDESYNFTYTSGTLTINKAIINVTVQDASRDYGQPNPSFTATYSGFKGTDNINAITVKPSFSCSVSLYSIAGSYDIVASGGMDENYSFTYVSGNLTINKVIDKPIGFSESNDDISVYPNPAIDFVTILRSSSEPIEVKVYDINGKILIAIVLNTDTLDVQSLISGVYFLSINNKMIKLIKQ